MNIKRVFLILLFFAVYSSQNKVSAVTVDEMLPEIKCPDDQESLEHQHGCPKHEEMLSLLQRLVGEGKTKDEILDAFVSQYGLSSLVNATGRGFGRTSYLVPIFGLLLVFVIIYIYIEKWIKRGEINSQLEKEKVTSEGLSGYEKKFNEEYENFKRGE
ncbi:MAG: cytochrome c-type biogenesis protein CcmH [bacterium]